MKQGKIRYKKVVEKLLGGVTPNNHKEISNVRK